MHLSAQRLAVCRWCERERPASTSNCPACGPPIVVRMVHDGVFGGLVGVPVAIVGWLGLWFSGHLDADLQLALYALPGLMAVVGVVVGLVASVAWRVRGRRRVRQVRRAAEASAAA